MCVGELAAALNMTKSAVSHQLKALRSAKHGLGLKNAVKMFFMH